MKTLPRIFMILAAISLTTLFLFPMWRITLIAPQYPTGITMYIWINKLGGDSPGTLQNVNILNHYVGMQKIEPDSIPELQYFPWVVGGLIAMALVAAIVNRRWAFLTWAVIFVLLAIAGIYDFYLWEYDYGHSLDATAPIKIPGASFQPPLLGTKQIINFTAQSYPHTSGWLAGLSVIFAGLAWWLKPKFPNNEA